MTVSFLLLEQNSGPNGTTLSNISFFLLEQKSTPSAYHRINAYDEMNIKKYFECNT